MPTVRGLDRMRVRKSRPVVEGIMMSLIMASGNWSGRYDDDDDVVAVSLVRVGCTGDGSSMIRSLCCIISMGRVALRKEWT